ncbi:hypothetical protein LINGRAHAP2_LOCUS38320 [Linum grandiflorum]
MEVNILAFIATLRSSF